MKNSMILMKTLLLSTSQRNIYRHSQDEKKKRKIILGTIGMTLLYLMLMAYCIMMCIGYGMSGLIDAAPVMCALIISVLAFFFTFFKTNGYLFNFKEYDMLMSLPLQAKSIAACKFMYMYVKSLPWYLSISFAMMLGYGYFAKPSVITYPVWMILSLFLPVIPMLISSFFGFIIAKISAGSRKTNLIQTVLTFVFIIFCISARFIIQDVLQNDKVSQTLDTVSNVTSSTADYYLPAKWFTDAVIKNSLPAIAMLVFISAALFALVFRVVGGSYRNINSALKSHAASKKFKMTAQKKRSVVRSLALKEYRRMTGSTVYMTNGVMGGILAAVLGIAVLFIGFDRIVGFVTHDAPIDTSMLEPAIPFIVYFFVGMVATTAFTPSLEGKNFWIIQSLPIEMKSAYQGKMLFNMCLSVPFTIFSTLCFCISAKAAAADTILYLFLGLALCSFSTTWGCVCGIKHMRLDWENEVEVIKQGAAVTIYLLPNMLAVMALMVLSVYLGTLIGPKTVTALFTIIAIALAALSYRRVISLSKNSCYNVSRDRMKKRKRVRKRK